MVMAHPRREKAPGSPPGEVGGRTTESQDNGTPMGQDGSRPEVASPIAVLAVTFLLFLAGVAGMFGAAQRMARLDLGLRAQVAVGTVLFALPVAAALALWPRARRVTLGDLAPGRRTVLLASLLGGALWIASIGLVELQALVRPPRPEELDLFRRLHAALAPHGVLDFLVSLAVIAALPALCEELVMRGALLVALLPAARAVAVPIVPPALVPRVAASAAVTLTAAAFALIHDPVRLLFAFALGLALGALRLRTRSLLPPVVCHATLNTLTFVLAPLVDDPAKPYEPQPFLGLGCLVVGLVLAWPVMRALRPRASDDTLAA
jgi:membrane protease YdiL (CAAX protease family)